MGAAYECRDFSGRAGMFREDLYIHEEFEVS